MDRPFSLVKNQRALAVAGLQTQHRTPMKVQPKTDKSRIRTLIDTTCREERKYIGWNYWAEVTGDLIEVADTRTKYFKPPSQVGDRLCLQEPYQIEEGSLAKCYIVEGSYLDDKKPFEKMLTPAEWKLWRNRKFPLRGTSGRFMYESLARHFFEVTGVKAEQVQDISLEDITAEGVPDHGIHGVALHEEAFEELWDSIYGGGKYEWKKNPWEWAITFRKV